MRWIERGTQSIQQYINDKYNWTHQYGNIDWKCIRTKNMGTGRRTFIISYSHQWLPLHESLHNRKSIGTPLCPMCSTDKETHLHFITCNQYPGNGIETAMTQIASVIMKEEVDPLFPAHSNHRDTVSPRRTNTNWSRENPKQLLPINPIAARDRLDPPTSRKVGKQMAWLAESARYDQKHRNQGRKGLDQEGNWNSLGTCIQTIDPACPEATKWKWKCAGRRTNRVSWKTLWKRRELPRRHQFLFRTTKDHMLNRYTKRIRKWVQDTEPILHRAITKLRRRHKEQTRMDVWLRWERRKKNRRRTQS